MANPVVINAYDMRRQGGMRQALAQAEALGVADLLAAVATHIERASTVDRRVGELHRAGRDARTRIINSLVDGEAPATADVALAVSTTGPLGNGSDRHHPVMVDAQKRARAVLHSTAYMAGLAAMAELHKRLVSIVDAAVKVFAAVELPPWTVREEDIFKDRKQAAAYADVREAFERFRDVHALVDVCRRIDWLPQMPDDRGDDMPAAWTAYRDPIRRPVRFVVEPGADERGSVRLLTWGDTINALSTGKETTIPAPLQVWHAVRVGAGPGLYDVADAEKRWRKWVNRVRADNGLRPHEIERWPDRGTPELRQYLEQQRAQQAPGR